MKKYRINLTVEDYFDYVGDYLLDDKKHYYVNPDLKEESLLHIYGG